MDLIEQIRNILHAPKTPCPDCYNSCGNEQAYYDPTYGCQCSTGWTDCSTCKGTGKVPNDSEVLDKIKAIVSPATS